MSLRAELVPTLRLAVPVVLAELGWMGMGVVDTIMVGPLGPSAIGAAGVGTSMQMALAIFGMGVLLGLDTLVSQAYGARDIDDCHRWLLHGSVLALLMTVPVMAVCLVVLGAGEVMAGLATTVWALALGMFVGELLVAPLNTAARSALKRSTNASSEKLESCPKAMSRARN